jgi:hypothetical protein
LQHQCDTFEREAPFGCREIRLELDIHGVVFLLIEGGQTSALVDALATPSGDGETPKELLAPENGEGHDGRHQTAPEARLLDDPDAGCLEQFGRQDRCPVAP